MWIDRDVCAREALCRAAALLCTTLPLHYTTCSDHYGVRSTPLDPHNPSAHERSVPLRCADPRRRCGIRGFERHWYVHASVQLSTLVVPPNCSPSAVSCLCALLIPCASLRICDRTSSSSRQIGVLHWPMRCSPLWEGDERTNRCKDVHCLLQEEASTERHCFCLSSRCCSVCGCCWYCKLCFCWHSPVSKAPCRIRSR